MVTHSERHSWTRDIAGIEGRLEGSPRPRWSISQDAEEHGRANHIIEDGRLSGRHSEGGRPRSMGSIAHDDAEAGFAHMDGDVNGPTGYNETTVDIVCVPCPGARADETWARQPLPEGHFGFPAPAASESREQPTLKQLAGDAILSPAINRHLPRAAHVWVRQGLRKEVSSARVLLYRHRALADGVNLELLARDLLHHVQLVREGLPPSRPLFFIAHSIGGLVVKLALLWARKIQDYRAILLNCHGVSFFATPHRGSSYLTMRHLKESIQTLLRLHRPLPRSLMEELRLGNKTLLSMHDQFVDLTGELRLWTFYETVDSQLSGLGLGLTSEVQFSAPIVSIKSAIMGLRHETVYGVDSDHAHCASFGPDNIRTMTSYLEDLTSAIGKAQKLSVRYMHIPLRLEEQVDVEVTGFYEDPDRDMEPAIRLYITKHHLNDFLLKGAEKCLEERLSKAPRRRSLSRPGRRSTSRRRHWASGSADRGNGLGIISNVQDVLKPLLGESSAGPDVVQSPDIVVTLTSARPLIGPEGTRSLPADALRRPDSLTIPALSSPIFSRPSSRASDGTTSTMSEPTLDLSPTSVNPGRGRATTFGPASAPVESRVVDSPARRQALERSLEEQLVGFSRPDPSLRRFMWIHLPFTNPLWVKEILDKLAETNGLNLSRLLNYENWMSRHVQGRHSQSQPSFIKPSCSYIQAESAPSPRVSPGDNGRATPSVVPNCLNLYLPYLHFDTYSNMIRRRKLINRRLAHGRARPVPQDIADLDSLDLRVIWKYIGLDLPVHFRRTLDQFGNPSLGDTEARDDDQMLYKLTREAIRPSSSNETSSGLPKPAGAAKGTSDDRRKGDSENDLRDGKVLMVDQLWLWAIDKNILASFFPRRESQPKEGTLFQQADLRNSVYNELNGDLTGRTENALDLAAFIAFHAVTVLLDRSSHPDLEVFRIFEEAIGLLTERMTYNLKKFRMQTFKEIAVGESDDDDPDENSHVSIKQRYRRELERAERENRENTSAVLELRDMEDELTTLFKVFDSQEATLRTMRVIYAGDDLKDFTHNGQAYLDAALMRLEGYKQNTNEMLRRVETTRKDYEKLLEMAQRQAQVDDVRWSRLQTELASSSNLSVMIFTIFTVIFLPLSFFCSLFSINTSDDDFSNMPLGTIGAIALPASAILIVASLIGAFSLRVQAAARALFRRTARLARRVAWVIAELEPRARRDAKHARRELEERERSEDLARSKKDREYDFWAMIKRLRGSKHEIPELNRFSQADVPQRKRTWRTWDSG